MITPCPHCQTEIEIDAATRAALAGQTHFACPACQGSVAVPGRRPAPASAHRGLNRNFLILGALTLLVLGGLGFYLVSQKSGDTATVNQNIRNDILNNAYFTQLIANGVTTSEELEKIGDIRPYAGGFVGISAEPLEWQAANGLARRTGSVVLAAETAKTSVSQTLISWLVSTFAQETASPLWMIRNASPAILTGKEVVSIAETDGTRKVLLHWHPANQAQTLKPADASKQRPFANSLAMKFVPVPGTNVLFCVHETRRKDYQAYAEANPNQDAGWRTAHHEGVACGENDDHPVVNVNWFDAKAFCAWLSKREGRLYRLPTDREWSIASGINDEIWEQGTTPNNVTKNSALFPWGKQWPRPKGVGNYMDLSWNTIGSQDSGKYAGDFTDGYPTTSPVLSFAPNSLGIHDMGGNVWEWVEDWFDENKQHRVLRGASWADTETWGGQQGALLSSFRARHNPNIRYPFNGFRVVLEANQQLPAGEAMAIETVDLGNWKILNGDWTDEDGGRTGFGDHDAFLLSDIQGSNFQYEADITIKTNSPSAGSLVFRAKENVYEQCYIVNISSEDGGLVKLFKLPYKELATHYTPVITNTKYRLKVLTEGENIKVYFDDLMAPIISVKDSSYKEGKFGLLSWQGTSFFKNVTIKNTE